MKRFITIISAVAIAMACMVTFAVKPEKEIRAEAWHVDFWNYYANCMVIYEQVAFNSYKVIVNTSDGHTIWTNDVDYIRYWYSEQQLQNMIGFTPTQGGAWMITCDVKKEYVNNTTFFAKFVM